MRGGSYDVGYMPVALEIFAANPGEGVCASHGILDGWGGSGWVGDTDGGHASGGADGVSVETEGLLAQDEVPESRRGGHGQQVFPNPWNRFKSRNSACPTVAASHNVPPASRLSHSRTDRRRAGRHQGPRRLLCQIQSTRCPTPPEQNTWKSLRPPSHAPLHPRAASPSLPVAPRPASPQYARVAPVVWVRVCLLTYPSWPPHVFTSSDNEILLSKKESELASNGRHR